MDRNAATTSRFDQYRDTLEAWAAWWNNVGRYHYRFHIVFGYRGTDGVNGYLVVDPADIHVTPGEVYESDH